jgi:hypothetical protein
MSTTEPTPRTDPSRMLFEAGQLRVSPRTGRDGKAGTMARPSSRHSILAYRRDRERIPQPWGKVARVASKLHRVRSTQGCSARGYGTESPQQTFHRYLPWKAARPS